MITYLNLLKMLVITPRTLSISKKELQINKTNVLGGKTAKHQVF